MSIALDTALYIREQKSSNPLTLSERGALFTLLFRIGSNATSWVSQETLALELDITERYVITLMQNISEKGYIKIKQNPKDKRKNIYSPAKFLINYHQLQNRAQTKKYRNNCSPNLNNTRTTVHLNTRTTVHLISDAQPSADPDNIDLNEYAQIPKGKEETYIKSKDKSICATDVAQDRFQDFWFIYPRKKDKKRAHNIWRREKLDNKADMIIEDVKHRLQNDSSWKDETYIPHPSTYLSFERWTDEVKLEVIKNKKEKFNPAQYALDQLKKNPEAAKEVAKCF